MGAKRIIPCLDIYGGKVVKNVNFMGLREVGEPLEYARQYVQQGADEILFLDVTSTGKGKEIMADLVSEAAKTLTVPILAGGGVQDLEDIGRLIQAGASKVFINTAAVKRPEILREAAAEFGSERIILSLDGKQGGNGSYSMVINGRKTNTGLDLVEWARQAEELGAGEILLASLDADSAKGGFDLPMLNAVCQAVKIPVIASGGCSTVGHFVKVFRETCCEAALAASIFHYGDLTVNAVKKALRNNGIPVNLDDGGRDLSCYFKKGELIPAIVQDVTSGEVLMLAYMNEESLKRTIDSGYTWFFSRSRGELWNKGATSGHYQKVISITPDCDNDTLLIHVEQTGPACHTGNMSCFYRKGILKNNDESNAESTI